MYFGKFTPDLLEFRSRGGYESSLMYVQELRRYIMKQTKERGLKFITKMILAAINEKNI